MERVINQELQPLPLEDGTVIGAAGTKEGGPREVVLSDKDRRLYVETGKLLVLKPVTQEVGGNTPPPPTQLVENKSGKVGK